MGISGFGVEVIVYFQTEVTDTGSETIWYLEVAMVEDGARKSGFWQFIVAEYFWGLISRGKIVTIFLRGLPAAVGVFVFGWLITTTFEFDGWVVLIAILSAVVSYFPGMWCYLAWRNTKYGFLFVLMNLFWGFHVAASWFPFLYGLQKVGFFDQILRGLANGF